MQVSSECMFLKWTYGRNGNYRGIILSHTQCIVDADDKVWISDFGSNSMYRFDPLDESFDKFDIPSPGANVRQILGIEGEIWGAESGSDHLLLIKTINSRTTDV